MGRRLGRVVAVVALGIAVTFTAGTAAQGAQAWVTFGDELSTLWTTDEVDQADPVTAPVLLIDYGWH
ncbi:hypothetical protein [Micromonospora sp. NBC_01813]|uniref:hypothetical protein n=1 Tax=Micromonospora sp. NBC_01813 TaxID=2975988 RepID=UPI002DDC3501|nr:hypothetical protein [Micromonospora sp. NBC_01813]WSA08165.1 hypothetical protein OG958_28825 [Micromonospora sp. NBC_01813]